MFPAKKLLIFLLMYLVSFQAFSQTSPDSLKISSPYRNLVLEGGGIRGIAYGGALEVLQEQEILLHITRVAGTSAGAIQAALLAVGYSPSEIADITAKTPVKSFNDGRLIFFGGFFRLFKNFGWYRGEKFSNWIGKLIEEKTGNADLTLGELHTLSSSGNFRDLYVVGTNLTLQREQVFSYETFPDMKIRDAVRISMSIPLYFRAVLIDTDGNLVKKPEKGQNVHVLVDGGIVANFPIHLFDRFKYLEDTVVIDTGSIFNPQTLGIRLDLPTQIEYDKQQQGLAPYAIDGFSDYIGALYNIIVENLNRQRLNPEDWARTISVSTVGYGPRIKHLSASDKRILWNSGRAGAELFLNTMELHRSP